MAEIGQKMMVLRLIVVSFLVIASVIVSAERSLKQETSGYRQTAEDMVETKYLVRVTNFLWQGGRQGHDHVWPVS